MRFFFCFPAHGAFFSDALAKHFVAAGFEVVSIDYVEKETVNHKEEIKMDRSFVQARCRKPSAAATIPDTVTTSAAPPPAAAIQT